MNNLHTAEENFWIATGFHCWRVGEICKGLGCKIENVSMSQFETLSRLPFLFHIQANHTYFVAICSIIPIKALRKW